MNLVTACGACNGRKADRTPEEAGMPLRVPAVRAEPLRGLPARRPAHPCRRARVAGDAPAERIAPELKVQPPTNLPRKARRSQVGGKTPPVCGTGLRPSPPHMPLLPETVDTRVPMGICPRRPGFDSRRHHHWIAHWVEQRPFNSSVAGSNPAPTRRNPNRSKDHAERGPKAQARSPSAAAARAPGKRGFASTDSRATTRKRRCPGAPRYPGPGIRRPLPSL
jgi:hypothetical protein